MIRLEKKNDTSYTVIHFDTIVGAFIVKEDGWEFNPVTQWRSYSVEEMQQLTDMLAEIPLMIKQEWFLEQFKETAKKNPIAQENAE